MFIYIVVLLTVTSFGCADTSHKEPFITPDLAEYVRDKCIEIVSNETRQLQVMQMYACGMKFNELKTGKDYYRFYCGEKMGEQCSEIIVSYYVDCLNSEEQYLSKFFTSSFQNAMKHFCGIEDVVSKFESIINIDCIRNEEWHNLLAVCLNNAFKIDDRNKFVLSHSLVCGQLPELKICFEEAVQLKCKSSLLDDVINDIFTPFVEWCNLN
ncbi:hypothetical protein FQR65_LT03064 [Abscondita terminalis]|nr:hypothetical protein FQR65_LT03064 [Abscondita terminalis]